MRKRFLSLVLALMLSLTLCTLTAFADDSALTLKFYNVVTSGITLEFSNALTSINGNVTEVGETIPLPTTFVIDSVNNTTVHISVNPKMDITKSYILNFEASDGTNTIKKQMLITFNVVVNDDFSSYSSLADMTTNYVGRIVDSAPAVTDKSLGFEFDNANKRVKLTTSDKFLRNKNVNESYYTTEFDLSSVDGTTFPGYMMHVRCLNGEFVNYCRVLSYFNGYFEFFNCDNRAGATFSLPENEVKAQKSYTITRKAYSDTLAYFSIYSDGRLAKSYTANNGYELYNTNLAISAWNTPIYLDNLKVYTAKMVEYEPIALSGNNTFLRDYFSIGFDRAPKSVTAEIKLGSMVVPTTTKIEKNDVVITPNTPFDLNKAYKVVLTASDGANTASFDKVVKLEELYGENFDSYTADTFRAKYTNTGLEFDSANKRLKLVGTNGATDFMASASAKLNKPIITEFDAESVKGTSTTDPTELYLDIGFGEIPTTTNNWYFYNQYANLRYGVYMNTTVPNNAHAPATVMASPKVKMTFEASNPLGTGTFKIYQNGVLKTTANNFAFNTYSASDSKFSIILALAGAGYNTYLDNIYMYSPVVYEPEDVPSLSVESCEITSKFVKVNFSAPVVEEEIESAVALMALGESVATTISLENDGKTVKIVPVSGSFDLDTEYVLKIDGLHDDSYTTLNLYQKRFMLEKLWAEDFENCETVNDLNGDYKIAMSGNPESIADNSAHFAIDTEENGNKRLKLVSWADNGAFTHIEQYPQRDKWKNMILEVDIATDSTWNLDIYYKMIYSNATGEFTGWWDGTSVLRFFATWTQNMVPTTGNLSPEYPGVNTDKESSLMFVPQNGKFNVYKNGANYISQDYNPSSFPVGEFGFRISSAGGVPQYIDNIKCYRVVDNIDDQVFIAGMKKTDTQVSGTIALNSDSDANVPESVLLVAVYDSNNKMLGVTTAEIDGTFKTAYVPYAVDYAGGTPKTIRAFLWDSVDGMNPVALNATKAIQ